MYLTVKAFVFKQCLWLSRIIKKLSTAFLTWSSQIIIISWKHCLWLLQILVLMVQYHIFHILWRWESQVLQTLNKLPVVKWGLSIYSETPTLMTGSQISYWSNCVVWFHFGLKFLSLYGPHKFHRHCVLSLFHQPAKKIRNVFIFPPRIKQRRLNTGHMLYWVYNKTL